MSKHPSSAFKGSEHLRLSKASKLDEGDESDRGGDDEVEEDAEDPARTIRLLRMNLRYYKTRYHTERALRNNLEKELAELKSKGKGVNSSATSPFREA